MRPAQAFTSFKSRDTQIMAAGSAGARSRSRSPRREQEPYKNALWAAVETHNHMEVERLLNTGFHVDWSYRRWTPLMKAAEADDVQSAELLLRFGANVDAVNRKGRTALSLAASPPFTPEGARRPVAVRVIELLVRNGASIDLPDAEGNTPLQWATRHGRREAIDVLRSFGAS